jgi:hypothetical protein
LELLNCPLVILSLPFKRANSIFNQADVIFRGQFFKTKETINRVCRFNTRPRFRIIARIDRHGISKGDILFLNRRGYFEQVPFAVSITEFDTKLDKGQQLQPVELFKHPFVVELMGAGFDKPANTRHFALRFPRVISCLLDPGSIIANNPPFLYYNRPLLKRHRFKLITLLLYLRQRGV